MTRQEVSIVSEVAGTTTDPVEKPMELLPLGPVLWIDTAGIDDQGALGEKRVQKTRQVFDRTDVGILVVDAGRWEEFEEGIFRELRERDDSGHRGLQQVGPCQAACGFAGRAAKDENAVCRNRRLRRAAACWNCARR